jgi:hypothetical protein
VDQQPRVRQVVLATGVRVSYVSAGLAAGAPVVLLHAWGESWRSFDRLLPLLPGTIHAAAMEMVALQVRRSTRGPPPLDHPGRAG